LDKHPINGFTGATCIPTLYRLLKEIVPALPVLVVSDPWQYQGQLEKMTVPMVFSY